MSRRRRADRDRHPRRTGRQAGQYVSAHGGICAYTFNPDGTVNVEPLELSEETLERMRTTSCSSSPARREPRRDSRRPGRSGPERRRGDARQPPPDEGDRTREPSAARARATSSSLRGADARALGEQAPPLAGDGDRADRPALHARAAQRRDRREARRSRRRRLPARLHARPDDTRQAMAAAGAPELRFGFEFQGCYGASTRERASRGRRFALASSAAAWSGRKRAAALGARQAHRRASM